MARATTEPYQNAAGRTLYCARWQDIGGAWRKKRGFTRKGDAQQYADKQSATVRAGTFVPDHDARATVGQMWESFIAAHTGRPATIRNYRSTWRLHLAPTFAELRLDQVARVAPKWLAYQEDTFAPGTAYGHLVALRAILASAKLPVHPLAELRRPEPSLEVDRLMTREMIDDFTAGMGPHYGMLCSIAAFTGARYGEAAGLQVDKIDAERGTARLDVQTSYVIPHGGRADGAPMWSLDKPKGFRHNPAVVRTVPVPPMFLALYDEYLGRYPVGEHGFIVATRTGAPVNPGTVSRKWATIRARLIGRHALWPTFHDLRHFYASLLIAAGLDVISVGKYLGHAPGSPMTQRIYGHLWHDRDALARDALTTVFSAPTAEIAPKSRPKPRLHSV